MLTRLLTKAVYRATSIKSVPGNLPPRKEDNAPGRYAGSLFSAASQKQQLNVVQEDLNWLGQLVKQSPQLKLFLSDISIQKTKQKEVLDATVSAAFAPTTKEFLHLLVDAGRLTELPKIIQKYDEYVKILSKQEDIRIISAKVLNEAEKKQVVQSLARGRPGVEFNVEYEIDPTILGGLQLYSGSTFLDCSLRSRLEKLRTELDRL